MLKLILFSSLLFSKAFSQEPIGCYVEGECLRSPFTGITQETSPLECLQYCQGRDDCNYYTHYSSTNACWAWGNCVEFSSDGCTDCISGDVSCAPILCSAPGLCTGLPLDFTVDVPDEDSCLARCTQVDGCEWYSYDLADRFCILTTDCNEVDNCLEDTCVHGQRECAGGEQPEEEKTKILVAGGRNKYDVEVINLAGDGKTCTAASLASSVEYPASLLTDTGEPLLCGGYRPITDECIRYDKGSAAWTLEDITLVRPRYELLSIEVSPKKYWIFGGSEDSSDIYENGVFTNGPILPDAMINPCGVKINDDLTFVASSSGLSVYLFDWRTMEFTSYPDTLIYPAQGSVCGLVTSSTGQQSIVIGSGDDSTVGHQIIEIDTMTVREGAELEYALSGGDSIPYGDTFLIVGGIGLHPNLFEYDPDNEVFVERNEALQTPRYNAYVSWVDDSQVICN